MPHPERPLVWIGSAEKDFDRFPDRVQDGFEAVLELAREGVGEIPGAKPLTRGILKGRGIMELVQEAGGDSYRVVYTTKLPEVLPVLHAFKKKAKSGVATPRHEIRLIRERFRAAVRLHSKQERHHRR